MRNVLAGFLTQQSGRFALFLPVFIGAGIMLYFQRATEPSLAWPLAALGGCVLGAIGVWRWQVARAAFVGIACGGAGFALACLATARAPPWAVLPHHAVVVSGKIAALDVLPQGRRITLADPSLDGETPLRRMLRIRLRDTDSAALGAGDIVQLRALLQAPSPPDYPGGWDTQRDAFFAGIGGYGFAIGPVQTIRAATQSSLTTLRESVAARIMAGLPGAPGAIAATLLTGIGTAIPAADRAAFEESGLAHLLAVAGLHIGIVMGLVFAVTRFALAAWEYAALAWPTRKIAAVVALFAGGFYLAMTGAHVPILRSFAMASLFTLGVLTGRRSLSMRGIALAATVLMVVSPASILGVSFQMSFSAVLCLIAGYEAARPMLLRLGEGAWWRRPALYGAGLVLTSLLAGTASLPFAMYHFGRATLYYVPANMAAVPVAALWIMPWGLAVLALMPFGLERLALVPMGWGIRAVTAIAHWVASWPAAILPVAQSPPWGLALIAAGLAWAGIFRGRLRLAGLAPLVLGLAASECVRRPDVLVGPDLKLIAVRLADGVALEQGNGVSAFESQAPAHLWGIASAAAFEDSGAGLTCTPSLCRILIRDQLALLARDAAGIDCSAALIISTAWIHGRCPKTLMVDHDFIRRSGATAIRLDPLGPSLTTDQEMRGARPWVIAETAHLPMARTE
jgi:competence protein ComEC